MAHVNRIYNFAAGPAVMPEPVLKQAQQDIWNVAGSGIGVMEHSHRGGVFDAIANTTTALCREIANIPDTHEVLYLTGGASTQFFMIPMNFLSKDRTADYINTGEWSKKAIKEAKLFGNVHVAGSSEDKNFNYIPKPANIRFSANPAYIHFTSNNTIFGTEWKGEPANLPANVPLICDASSDIFSRPIDISKYAMIYAGAQKNLGPSGIVLVIMRKYLIEAGKADLPTMLQYRTHAANGSMYNTPPTFPMYLMGETFKWIKSMGGLAGMAAHNQAKAKTIYEYLDNTDFFRPTAEPDSRSLMNITFRGPNEDLEKAFVKEATARGLDGLKGHRSVGGMRASVYNAFPLEGCKALVDFMKEFEKKNR